MRYAFRSRSFFRMLGAASLWLAMVSGCAEKPDVAEDIRPVRAITLTATSQHLLADYSGHVQPRIHAQLGFRVGGKISARKVDVGQAVKAGQVLLQLDPEDLQLAKLEAEGNFKAAESNLELANNELKRYRDLLKTHAISQSMLDAKMTAAAAAAGNFAQAKAQLQAQSNQANYASLVASSAGVVTRINAEVGQVVSAGAPVIEVAQLNEMEVVVGVPENNVDIVSRAEEIHIYLWADPQTPITGKLRELAPVADPATRTFAAKVSILNPSPKVAASVKMGMTANVQFVINTPNPFIKVPLSALLQEKGVTSVWIIENGAVKLVPVQIGGVNGNDLLITSGLSAGQTLVTAGVHLLKPGQRVSILKEVSATIINDQPYLSAQTLLKAKSVNAPVNGDAVPKTDIKQREHAEQKQTEQKKETVQKESTVQGAVQ